jgi:hypothetical protein
VSRSSPSSPAAFNHALYGGSFFNGLQRTRGRDRLTLSEGACRRYRLPCRGPDHLKGVAIALPFAWTPRRGGKLVGESLVGLQWSWSARFRGINRQGARPKVAMGPPILDGPDLDYDLALRLAR